MDIKAQNEYADAIENNEIPIVKQTKTIGSNLSIPIILSKYNLNVYYFSNIGDDIEGKEIINYLHSNKINTDYINTLNNTKTNKRYIIINNKNNSKTVLSERVFSKYSLIRKIDFMADIIYNDTYELDIIKELKNSFNNIKIVTNLTEITQDMRYMTAYNIEGCTGIIRHQIRVELFAG